jgi:DNA end-binding protein Ku
MSHAIWSGVIKFGLVTIPVKLQTAVRTEDIALNMLHGKDSGRIRFARICELDGAVVPSEEIVKGYEYEAGEYVMLNEDDVKAVKPESSGAVDILEFVDAEQINPMLYDKPYYLEPGKGGGHAYALLRQALRESNRVAISRVVIRTKEHLAAVRVVGNAIILQLMNWAGEIVDEASLPNIPPATEELPAQELAMAKMLLDSMGVPTFEPTKFANTYRDELLALIADKAAGIERTPQPAKKREKVVNIMDALLASIEAKKQEAA